jgi:hypothetical protein
VFGKARLAFAANNVPIGGIGRFIGEIGRKSINLKNVRDKVCIISYTSPLALPK